jgi:hypothetical protein
MRVGLGPHPGRRQGGFDNRQHRAPMPALQESWAYHTRIYSEVLYQRSPARAPVCGSFANARGWVLLFPPTSIILAIPPAPCLRANRARRSLARYSSARTRYHYYSGSSEFPHRIRRVGLGGVLGDIVAEFPVRRHRTEGDGLNRHVGLI